MTIMMPDGAKSNAIFVRVTDLPIACTLDAATLAERGGALLPGLARRAASRLALPDGVRLTFTPTAGLLSAIADVLAAEHQCCRFLRFQVTVEPGDGPVLLDVAGPPGTGDFLAQLTGG